jgi:hypothetical protein
MRHKRTGWWCCVVWTAALLCRVRAQTSLVLGYSSELEDERFDEKNVERWVPSRLPSHLHCAFTLYLNPVFEHPHPDVNACDGGLG